MRTMVAVAALTVPIAVCGMARAAEWTYQGPLDGSRPFRLTVNNALSLTGVTLLTITYFRGSPQASGDVRMAGAVKVEHLSVGARELKSFARRIPESARGIILEVHPAPDGAPIVEIVQGDLHYPLYFWRTGGSAAFDVSR